MRISDWSSDVCSSDLHTLGDERDLEQINQSIDSVGIAREWKLTTKGKGVVNLSEITIIKGEIKWSEPHGDALEQIGVAPPNLDGNEIGRASCRERVCQYV